MGEEEEKRPAAAAEEQKKTEESPVPAEKKTEDSPAEKKEENKTEESNKDEKKTEGKKDESSPAELPAPPPPPQEIVLKVYMHCEGCARKVRRCLKGFPGVEEVATDCKTSKVVVKGEKADPLKVAERVQRKSHRQVELLSPIPKPPSDEEKKAVEEEKPKPEEKKVEPPPVVITAVLKVHMHCEACAQEIKKRILKMKGVESAEPDLKNSEVTVKGVFEPLKLVEYIYKRTGKQAVIIKQEPDINKEEAPKSTGGGVEEDKRGEEKKEEEKKDDTDTVNADESTSTTKVVELKRNEYYYYPPRYAMEMYTYPPQMFSDENPNACSLM